MSFILDALKKSENERQRHIGPSLADVQIRRRQNNRPWWVVVVASLLVINLGVLLIVLTRRDGEAASLAENRPETSPNPPAGPFAQTGAASGSRAPQPLAQASASPAVRSLADEADAYAADDAEGSFPGPDLDAASTVPHGPPMVRPIDAPSVAPLDSGTALQARQSAPNEMLPTLSDLTASGTSLPELHLDIHVHSGKSNERFVFVNMRKYVEGQALTEGPTVEEITTEGVVLNQHGLRFLLPRQ